MNILHVVNIYFVLPYFIGGQFKYFKSKGYNMNVACSPSQYLDSYSKEQGFNYIETPINRSISIKDDLKSICKIIKFIKRQNIDIIVGHTPKGGLLSMIAGWLSRVPRRIYFRHGLVYETSSGLKRQLLITVDRLSSFFATEVICVSKSVLERSIQDKLCKPQKQLILGAGTCNGVDTESQFNPSKINKENIEILRRKYEIKNNDFVIGYSGRLVRDKGIEELITAFDLLEKSENCKLLLVGMFEERDPLSNEIKERIKCDPQIIYTGLINSGMENYYSLMDVYVLPSYREGFPTGVLEAQSMGLPVITTRVTGCCDSIVEGVTGLFASHSPKDIAEKIDYIRIRHVIDGDKGREWVIKNFDSRKVWKEIEKLYQ